MKFLTINKFVSICISFLVIICFVNNLVYASDFTREKDNENYSTTTISQSNDTAISNVVTSHDNTGNNTAVNNPVDTFITTGDMNSKTVVATTTTNNNRIILSCDCVDQKKINSKNAAIIEQQNKLTNNSVISEYENTGKNTISNVLVDPEIKTGDVNASIDVTISDVNSSFLFAKTVGENKVHSYKDIGEKMYKKLTFDSYIIPSYSILNYLKIDTAIYATYKTGKNNITNVSSSAKIITGKVVSQVNFYATNLNTSEVVLEKCVPEKNHNEKPPSGGGENNSGGNTSNNNEEHNNNENNSSSNSNSSSTISSSSNTSSPTSVLGEILPATGENNLFVITIILFTLLLLGMILVFHSGLAPPQYVD